MKNKRNSVVLICIVSFIATVWLFMSNHGSLPAVGAYRKKATKNVATDAPVPPAAAKAENKGSEGNKPTESQRRYLDKARSEGRKLNRSVYFYGVVLDQHGKPVPNVQVQCGLSRFSDILRPGLMPHYDKFLRETDASGQFSIEEEVGLALDLELMEKSGYEFRPNKFQVSFRDVGINEPAPAVSSREHPFVFHAFVQTSGQVLTHAAFSFYDVVPDGRPYNVSLQRRIVTLDSGPGDFTLSIQRPLGRMGQTDYNWSVQLNAVRFELIESRDEFMYQAPEAGYAVSWKFAAHAGSKDYERTVSRKFYIKSAGGIYGRLEILIISDQRERAGVNISYWLNPAGSTNLEPVAPQRTPVTR